MKYSIYRKMIDDPGDHVLAPFGTTYPYMAFLPVRDCYGCYIFDTEEDAHAFWEGQFPGNKSYYLKESPE